MTRKPSSPLNLTEEAAVIFPIIQSSLELYHQGRIRDFDVVGLYILAYLSLRRPRSWSNGLLPHRIIPDESTALLSGESAVHEEKLWDGYTSALLTDLPPTLLQLLDEQYLRRKLQLRCDGEEGDRKEMWSAVSVMDVFNRLQLTGIKCNVDHYVNKVRKNAIQYYSLNHAENQMLHMFLRQSLVLWAAGHRPFKLLFFVPAPLTVLKVSET